MVVRVEYERFNRVCNAYEGQVIGLSVQSPRGHFSVGGHAPMPPPLAGAGAARRSTTAAAPGGQQLSIDLLLPRDTQAA